MHDCRIFTATNEHMHTQQIKQICPQMCDFQQIYLFTLLNAHKARSTLSHANTLGSHCTNFNKEKDLGENRHGRRWHRVLARHLNYELHTVTKAHMQRQDKISERSKENR